MNIVIDAWYIPAAVFQNKAAPRRVLAVGNGFVLYSDPRYTKTEECTLDKFEEWYERYSCSIQEPRR